MIRRTLVLATLALAATALPAQVTVKHIQSDKSPIATGVWAGDVFYLSGQLASPLPPADPAKPPAIPEYGDTRAQAASVFAKIQAALKEQGLDMKDVVKMTVFLAPDPKTGKMDFPAMQGEYMKFFGTAAQPNKPARSTFQVAALVAPWAMLEVEVIAVKSK